MKNLSNLSKAFNLLWFVFVELQIKLFAGFFHKNFYLFLDQNNSSKLDCLSFPNIDLKLKFNADSN